MCRALVVSGRMETSVMLTIEGLGVAREHAAIAALTLAVALVIAPAPGRADIVFVGTSPSGTGDLIEEYDSATGADLGAFVSSGLQGPWALAFDSADNLFVANEWNNTISKFTPSGTGSIFASNGLNEPFGLAFDSAGNLYAANAFDGTIEKFTAQGVASVFASGLSGPTGLAFDSSGNLYVSNLYENRINRITPGGVVSLFATNGLSVPWGLAFDRAGNLYVANESAGNGAIEEFTPTGDGSVFATGLGDLSNLAFDSAGNLYAVGGNVTRFDWSNGALSHNGSIFAEIFASASIAIEDVPEPSTWAMVGLGLSVLLVFFRRKV